MPKNKMQASALRPSAGIEHGPLHPESKVLTIMMMMTYYEEKAFHEFTGALCKKRSLPALGTRFASDDTAAAAFDAVLIAKPPLFILEKDTMFDSSLKL